MRAIGSSTSSLASAASPSAPAQSGVGGGAAATAAASAAASARRRMWVWGRGVGAVGETACRGAPLRRARSRDPPHPRRQSHSRTVAIAHQNTRTQGRSRSPAGRRRTRRPPAPPPLPVRRFKLPRTPAKRAPLLALRPQPSRDALQVERVRARAPHDGRVVPGELGVRWRAVERRAADAAHIVAGVPRPGGDGAPVLHLDAKLGRADGDRGRGRGGGRRQSRV
jgi:hypothetical protein